MSIPSNTDTLIEGDKLYVRSSESSDVRLAALSVLRNYLDDFFVLKTEGAFTSQYASPTAGATVQVTDGSSSIHLILTPTGTLATLTVKLPTLANLVNKQEVLVTSTQALTALTIDINGASNIFGAPTSLSAGGFFRLKYDSVLSNWNRVG